MWKPRAKFPPQVLTLAESERRDGSPGWYWLSFVDDRKPKGKRFLGVAIVEGYGIATAAMEADRLGVNPGGAVQSERLAPDAVPDPALRNRLLSKQELIDADLI